MRELYSYNQLCNSTLDLSPAPGASSESSSPRSSSTDDDLLEVHRASDQNHCNTSKPIYNFSIPDFIKHERQPVTTVPENPVMDSPVIVAEYSSRSRNVKRRYRDSADNETRDIFNVPDNSGNCRRQKRRRINQRNTIQSPQLIDLTGTDHEDTSAVGVVEEINHSPYLDSTLTGVTENARELSSSHHSHSAVSFDSVAENLQNFRRRLCESRDRINQIRREVTARESRLRYRLSHRSNLPNQNIVSDGLAYTLSNDANITPQDQSDSIDMFISQDATASVINVDDDNAEPARSDADREIALRMLEDPLYAPAFLTPHRTHNTAEPTNQNADREITLRMLEDPLYSPPCLTPRSSQRSTASRPPMLETLEENLDRINQRTREQMANFQHTRQHVQDRINEARSRLSRAEQRISGRFQNHIAEQAHENRQSEDEVEFLRELRPSNASTGRNARASHIDLDASNETNYNWGHLSRARRRFSGLFSNPNINVPDFLFPYVHLFNPAAAPRLRHFPSNTNDEGEDYEALWNLAERLGPAKPRGLTKSEIDRIHAFRFSASCAEETNSTCVVCMSEYIFREKIRKLPCTHDFHSKCIDKWLRSNKTCPVCRDEIKCM